MKAGRKSCLFCCGYFGHFKFARREEEAAREWEELKVRWGRAVVDVGGGRRANVECRILNEEVAICELLKWEM